jgi:hypothetical protein
MPAITTAQKPLPTLQLQDCTFLAGSYYRLPTGPGVLLTFHDDELAVQVSNAAIRPANIPYLEIVSLGIDGPGQVSSGGGFIGGGFGVVGALEGMAISAVLNAATTKTSIHTFIQILTLRGEMFFHWGGMGPAALRMFLSPVFTRLRQLDLGASLGQLERLAALRARDMLTEAEFVQLKALIIGQHVAMPSPLQDETTERTAPSHSDRQLPSWPVRER